MAASPRWKVYTQAGEYVASCKHAEDAAALVGIYLDGATVRAGHTKVVWTEGKDGNAAESYDECAEVIMRRAAALRR